jgi:hypothetical protein
VEERGEKGCNVTPFNEQAGRRGGGGGSLVLIDEGAALLQHNALHQPETSVQP